MKINDYETFPLKLMASKGVLLSDNDNKPLIFKSLDEIKAFFCGGNSSVQDMQMTWTPANVVAPQVFGFDGGNFNGLTSIIVTATQIQDWNNSSAPTLQSLSFPNLLHVVFNGRLAQSSSPVLATFSAPNLITTDDAISFNNDPALTTVVLTSLVSTGNGLDFSFDTTLVSLSLPAFVNANGNLTFGSSTVLNMLSVPSYVPNSGETIDCSNCNLNAASVNLILHRAVLNAGYVAGTINLSGGTNAAPTGAGIADKTTLIGRGVVVTTN